MPDPSDAARAVYERNRDHYRQVGLDPAERALLARHRESWPRLSMLDVGIGAGRTTWTFGSVAGRYVGIDYAPAMVDLARGLLPPEDRVQVRVGDARDLQAVGELFDVVLFSFNGIDTLGHDDRLAVLRQVRSVLRDDGEFLFSSHSLVGLRGYLPVKLVRLTPSPWSVYRLVREGWRSLRLQRVKRGLDWDRAARDGWLVARDGTHDFTLDIYHVTPAEQARQLAEAGLEVVAITDADGSPVDLAYRGESRWLHYLCRPIARDGAR